MPFSKNKTENVLSAKDRLRLLSAVWRSITAIEHLRSEVSSVHSVTGGLDITKTIQSGLPVLQTTLNDIQASLLQKIEKDAESAGRKLIDENSSSNT